MTITAEYIYQEIQEQERITLLHRQLPPPEWPQAEGRIVFVGAGDSHCAALFGAWVARLAGHGEVAGLPAFAGSQEALSLGENDVLVGLSVSGRTNRVVEAAQRARGRGAKVVAVTDDVTSPLAAAAHHTWPLYASPEEALKTTNYKSDQARQYVGYHHDVAQTKTFWAALLVLCRAVRVALNWDLLVDHTRKLLAGSFYQEVLAGATQWGNCGQAFFLGSGAAGIAARFGCYKMFEFNRCAHHTGLEEYCHTHYFITRQRDAIVMMISDAEAAVRAAEIAPVLVDLFEVSIIWLQPRSVPVLPPRVDPRDRLQAIWLPEVEHSVHCFLNTVLAVEWITYAMGRATAIDINTFHAGYDTEVLVAGTLKTIRSSRIRPNLASQPEGRGRKRQGG